MHYPKIINISQPPRLHNNILDILFKHKSDISRKLNDVRGMHDIDHIAINITSPTNEIVVLSSTPSVEYNLIIQELWKFDQSFHSNIYHDGSFFWWDQAYAKEYAGQLKYAKETLHHFSLGFNLVRKIDKFSFTYSFATRKSKALKKYYENIIDELFSFGDYGYKLLRDIYAQYCILHTPPIIEKSIFEKNKILLNEKPYLKLIINNTTKSGT